MDNEVKLYPIPEQRHRDGHGLADQMVVVADLRDTQAGNVSHRYEVFNESTGELFATIQFQHGPRTEPTSKSGLLDGVLLTILIDRFESFQSGPFASDENTQVLEHLKSALEGIKARAHRAREGTLGTLRR